MKRQRLVELMLFASVALMIGSVATIPVTHFPMGMIEAHAKQRQLLDQQIAILVGLKIDPHWVKQQASQGNLIYGVVKPSDTAPDGMQDYSYLATTD